MGAPSTTKLTASSSARRPVSPCSEPTQAQASSSSTSTSTPGPSRVHNRRSQPHHAYTHTHTHAHHHSHSHGHSYFPQPIIYTPHELFAISPDWSETVRARLQLLSSPEVLSRSPLEEQPPTSPSSGYLLAGNSKKRRRSHCIHDLPVHARRSIVEANDVDVDHTPKLSSAVMDGVEGEGEEERVMTMEDGEDEDRGRSRSRRSSMASFKTRRSERSVSRRAAGTKSRRQSEGQRDRAALMAILATTPLETPS